MIKIYHAYIDQQMPDKQFRAHLSRLPQKMQQHILEYRRWQDAHAGLFGKLLLADGLRQMGYPHLSLYDIKYTDYNRPYLEAGIDFNISHSGSCVACIISTQGKVGLDVEEIREVPLEHFEEIWTQHEWQKITQAPDPQKQFFRYWTQKEAVIKMDGRGLSIPLTEIALHEEQAKHKEHTWYLKEVPLSSHYMAHVATEKPLLHNLQSQLITFQ